MTNNYFSRRSSTRTLVAIALFSMACSEPYRSTITESPAPAVEAVLVVSDSIPPVGGSLVVSVQAAAKQGIVGSYTVRIIYDSTALRYDGEVPMNDTRLRASNSSPGLLRLAGAAPTGFADGRLATYRFAVLRLNSARTLSLVVDEMHMITRLDAKTGLTVAPVRITSR